MGDSMASKGDQRHARQAELEQEEGRRKGKRG